MAALCNGFIQKLSCCQLDAILTVSTIACSLEHGLAVWLNLAAKCSCVHTCLQVHDSFAVEFAGLHTQQGQPPPHPLQCSLCAGIGDLAPAAMGQHVGLGLFWHISKPFLVHPCGYMPTSMRVCMCCAICAL